MKKTRTNVEISMRGPAGQDEKMLCEICARTGKTASRQLWQKAAWGGGFYGEKMKKETL